ncbi:MAG TPA: hypothetical protein VLT83_12750 [Opitutaceae bacterium]|nr:hypothetical protein [Opitutaceae bacterium]
MPAPKRLDEKLARIRAGRAARRDFIIADAKDADMAFGLTAPGPRRHPPSSPGTATGAWKSLEDYRQQIRDVVAQEIVDLVLLSVSNLEQLAMRERLFDRSPVTAAARANDTTDIWMVRGGEYPTLPSRPFRTASIEHIKYGRLTADCTQPPLGADLGLYSLTFTNNLDWDHRTLEAFAAFRHEAEAKQFRYILEVFNPNIAAGVPARAIGAFLNDHIVRTLAGVPSASRPLFLKIPYHGPGPLEELVAYDPGLIVGILGGSAGTTFDAFQLIHAAQQHGAWVALFGRKINLSEHPLTFLSFLRRIVDGEIKPAEAVRAYHAALQRLGIRPHRPLRLDLRPGPRSSHYLS